MVYMLTGAVHASAYGRCRRMTLTAFTAFQVHSGSYGHMERQRGCCGWSDMPWSLKGVLGCSARLAVRTLLQPAPATWETPGKRLGLQMRRQKLLRSSPLGGSRFEMGQQSPPQGASKVHPRLLHLLPVLVDSLQHMCTKPQGTDFSDECCTVDPIYASQGMRSPSFSECHRYLSPSVHRHGYRHLAEAVGRPRPLYFLGSAPLT